MAFGVRCPGGEMPALFLPWASLVYPICIMEVKIVYLEVQVEERVKSCGRQSAALVLSHFASKFGVRTAGIKTEFGQLSLNAFWRTFISRDALRNDLCGSVGLLTTDATSLPTSSTTEASWVPKSRVNVPRHLQSKTYCPLPCVP